MSHCIKVAAREGKKIVYTECWMSWTDAAYGNTNKKAVWLMVWNLALYLYCRTYMLLKILTSKMIYYCFICRSKMGRGVWRFSRSYPHVLKFVVTSKMMGWGKMNVFQFLKFLSIALDLWFTSGDVFTFCWHGCECGHWFLFFFPHFSALLTTSWQKWIQNWNKYSQVLQASLIPLSIFNLISN